MCSRSTRTGATTADRARALSSSSSSSSSSSRGGGGRSGEHELLSQFMLPVLTKQHIEQRLPAMLDGAGQWDMWKTSRLHSRARVFARSRSAAWPTAASTRTRARGPLCAACGRS